MAATVLARAGLTVHVYEKRKAPGRKILIAGSSGLNITYSAPASEFHTFYPKPKSAPQHFQKLFQEFSPEDWVQFVESLGVKTFVGTSRRYFVKGMKGSLLLRAWIAELKKQGVLFFSEKECTGFEVLKTGVEVNFGEQKLKYSACVLALGGGSYEEKESPLRWIKILKNKQIEQCQFEPENSGFEVKWKENFLKEAEGKPLKHIKLATKKGTKEGELVVTRYGLEGTPVYTLGTKGTAHLDLLPDFTEAEIVKKLTQGKENLSPIRSAKKNLKLAPASHALLFHYGTPADLKTPQALAKFIKAVPVELLGPRPLAEAISSSGGVTFANLNETLMLKKHPGVFMAGEMLDWTAPTGGFLIQACASQGALAGRGVLDWLADSN